MRKTTLHIVVGGTLVLFLLGTNFSGVGISYDTTEYFAGAKHLVESGVFAGVDGTPQATWPPGYSFLLSLPLRVGFALETASLIITALSLAVIAFAALAILRRYGTSPALSAISLILLFLLPPLIAASSVALSELPFIATILAAVSLATWRQAPWCAVTAGLLCGAAYSMRYVGLIFIPVVALIYVLRFATASNIRALFIDVTLLIASAAVMPLWWTLRNVDAAGSATGNREPGGGTLPDASLDTIKALGQLVIGERSWATSYVAALLGFVILGLTIGASLAHLRHRRFDLAVVALVPLGYMAFTAYRYVYAEYAPIDLRAMTPLLPFVILTLASLRVRLPQRRFAQIAFGGIAALVIATGVLQIESRSSEARAWGSPRFQDTPLARAVKSLEDDSVFISNFPQRAFSLTHSIPIRNQFQFDLPPIETCRHRYGLWFTEAPFQGNEPTAAKVLYHDDEGRIFDLGDCTTPPKSFWE